MNGPILTDAEAEELFVLLKPREDSLGPTLKSLLARIEHSLYDRLTIQQIEELGLRFSAKS